MVNNEVYRRYLKTAKWREIRKEKLIEVDYQCEDCGSTKDLEVHHIVYPEKLGEEDMTELAVLCKECHENEHGEDFHEEEDEE